MKPNVLLAGSKLWGDAIVSPLYYSTTLIIDPQAALIIIYVKSMFGSQKFTVSCLTSLLNL